MRGKHPRREVWRGICLGASRTALKQKSVSCLAFLSALGLFVPAGMKLGAAHVSVRGVLRCMGPCTLGLVTKVTFGN